MMYQRILIIRRKQCSRNVNTASPMDCAVSVSYTHLDVYKSQALNIPTTIDNITKDTKLAVMNFINVLKRIPAMIEKLLVT